MKIYCLGDSLTAGYGVAPHKNWVSLLGSRGKNLWINGGISGDTSPGLLARLQTAAIPQKPDMVIWMGGFNDILLTGSADLAKACVMAFVNHCAAAGIRPVIGIPFLLQSVAEPWCRLCDWKTCRPVLEDYVLWLRRFCEAARLRCVDFREAGAHLLPDGMHPTEEGHRVMAEAVVRCPCFREESL